MVKGNVLVVLALVSVLCLSVCAQEKKPAAAGEKAAAAGEKPAEKGTVAKGAQTVGNGFDRTVDGMGEIVKGVGRVLVGTCEVVVGVVVAPFKFVGELCCKKKGAEPPKEVKKEEKAPAKK